MAEGMIGSGPALGVDMGSALSEDVREVVNVEDDHFLAVGK